MNRLILIMIMSLLSNIAIAQEKIGVEYFHSDDNEDITMQKVSTYAYLNNIFGVGYSDVQYSAPGYDADGKNAYAKINYDDKTQSVIGDVGVGKAENKTFFVGDLTYTYNATRNLSLFTGVSGDLVDSTVAIERGVTQYAVNLGVDAHADKYGLFIYGRQANFSNNNVQQGWFAKAYVSPVDWVLLYTSTKRYTNSKPYNGDFYSPDKYERNNVGITLRNGYEWGIVSGTFERNTVGDGNAWAFKLSSPRRAKYQWGVSYFEDTSEYTGFKFRMIMFNFAIPI